MPLMNIEIIGLKNLITKLDSMNVNFNDAVSRSMNLWLKVVERIIKREKLSGQVLHRRTSMLVNSIRTGVLKGNTDVMGYITAGTPYAAIHEFGGEIKFKKRNLTIIMPERSYIRSTIDEEKQGLFETILYESFTKIFKGER